jgi:hypothetical protein
MLPLPEAAPLRSFMKENVAMLLDSTFASDPRSEGLGMSCSRCRVWHSEYAPFLSHPKAPFIMPRSRLVAEKTSLIVQGVSIVHLLCTEDPAWVASSAETSADILKNLIAAKPLLEELLVQEEVRWCPGGFTRK